ncbi:MAG: efflux RND transporter periplasmic adaptor subunit [Alphaproteobacteria bacterium]|nr:efflux RND transporter periplasmic adaptor subunit [Alphaproteobacteria bacterium]
MNLTIKNNIFILVFTLFLITCKNKTTENNTAYTTNINIDSIVKTDHDSILFLSSTQLKNLDITFGNIERKLISKEIQLNGQVNVQYNRYFQLTLPLGGYVTKIFVKHGTKVDEGDSLLIAENIAFIDIQEKYLLTKIHQKELEQELVRKNELKKNNAISDKDYQQFENNYLQNKVLLKSYYEQLKVIDINPENLTSETISKSIVFKAPDAGIVTNIKPAVGRYFNPTDDILTIRNFDDMHLHLKAFEKDLELLKEGQKVWAYTINAPDRKYLATIKIINISFDNDKTVEVHCEFNEKLPIHLIPGLYMGGLIQIDPIYAYCLPEEAVLSYQDKKYVFAEDLNKPQHFDFIEVNIGIEDNETVQILNYHKLLNRKIVTQGAYFMMMQLKNTNDDE